MATALAASPHLPHIPTMTLRFDNSWTRDLPGTFLRLDPDRAPAPRLLALNRGLAADIGLDSDVLAAKAAGWFSGAEPMPGADPVALA
ncbi:MAG: hypothetical protein WAT25_14365, partial [Paracoccaceae bacterium]